MPTASAEMDGFSVEIAVRSVIKTAPAQKLFSPQRQQQMQGNRSTQQSAAFQGMFLQPPAIQFIGYW